jgi:hypothetical protein
MINECTNSASYHSTRQIKQIAERMTNAISSSLPNSPPAARAGAEAAGAAPNNPPDGGGAVADGAGAGTPNKPPVGAAVGVGAPNEKSIYCCGVDLRLFGGRHVCSVVCA